MSAGLFPIVPTMGGQSEFVPKQFQYRSLDDAVKIVSFSKLDTSTGLLLIGMRVRWKS